MTASDSWTAGANALMPAYDDAPPGEESSGAGEAIPAGPRPLDPAAPVALEGTLERITFRNEENGWTIGRLRVPRHKNLITVAGTLPTVHTGEMLRLEGTWREHPQYGRQLQVIRYQALIPGTIPGLKRYLGSGLLKGVGPAWAEQLVDAFGFDTLEVLERAPERLQTIPGLGPARAAAITRSWREQVGMRDLMEFLQAEGLPIPVALRIARRHGSAAAHIVRTQPYHLVADILGITFEQADQLARRGGLPADSPPRIHAGIEQVLREAGESGHTWVAREALLARAAGLLDLPLPTVTAELPSMVDAGLAIVEPGGHGAPRVFAPSLHEAELFVAGAVRALRGARDDRLAEFHRAKWPHLLRFLERADPDSRPLSEQQQQAVRLALTERLVVLTGGPGTGKTTTLRALIQVLQAREHSVLLAAPTGRAARRLTEATGAPARTLHRLLDLRPNGSGAYEHSTSLDADMVIVDEASMMDIYLAQALLRAVPPGAHLLLVGDPDQLPSVGPGQVLQDIIASESVPVVRLTTIFRQAETSGIAANAHLINAGELPRLTGFTDFYHLRATQADACAELVVDLVARRLPQTFGLDPLEDIQVLVPLYQGPAGVDALNARLQERLNPPTPARRERTFGTRTFREGDKVMQVVNDYERQVFNGDIGRIVQIDPAEQQVRVVFDNEWPAVYAFADLDELTHAYAISVHKSQGSEYPVVVMPLLRLHGRMLQRNLLYTGISRARRLVVLVGEREAIGRAVATSLAGARNTGLAGRLSAGS